MILLHIPADPTAPVACDMTAATDTPEARLAEYARIVARSFSARQRDALSVTLSFHDEPGVADWLQDLARREAACCPFFDYRIERRGAHLDWTIAGPDDATVQAMLDEFHALPETAAAGVDAFFDRLAVRGVDIDRPTPERFRPGRYRGSSATR